MPLMCSKRIVSWVEFGIDFDIKNIDYHKRVQKADHPTSAYVMRRKV
jgi:hypothetical protein